MLAYVPVAFAAYRDLKPRLWPVMQVLVAHADRQGRCWPSVRRIAEITGVPKSSVARYLRSLEHGGTIARSWRRGCGAVYTVAARFLPAAVSHRRVHAVPPSRTEEIPLKKTSDSALPDNRTQWQARLRAWEKSRFWLPQWGSQPGDPGCIVPASAISLVMARAASTGSGAA